ncbi:hypothetical protein BDZ94DRAFT_1245397 [Collybia nuda]|uniref:DUF7719 domain-containing protein n=1 Tax=Collybia nuda TaxID=64659 RepID=A0A9P6CK23_9AGAR|nr:hypothetical protein BDZ94DRAFT_1245397 [Collybia nuda]
MARNRTQKNSQSQTPSSSIEIPEDEQMRLIKESGIMGKIASIPKPETLEEDITPFAEEMFGAVVLIIPFCFLLLLMEILIHFQYRKQPTFEAVMDRMVPGVPILSIFVFYTTRYKAHRVMQLFLFVLSVLVGARMLYLINWGSWLVNMRQCPALATIWVYTVVQLDLGPAVVALAIVGGYVWWQDLQILL